MKIRGRYQILYLLGEGKFGKVFKAMELVSTKVVAIKMEYTKPGLLKHETTILNYLNKKKCQNVPNIFWFGIESNVPCLIISFYPCTFMEYLKKSSFHHGKEKKVLQSMLKIIENVHDLGVLHRDIKPDNFMLNEKNQLILIDFGLSIFIEDRNNVLKKKDMEKDSSITGNILFASPKVHEMYHSRKIDDLISIAYIGLYMSLHLNLPWLPIDGKESTINYLFLKGKDSLQLNRNADTNQVIDFIFELYEDKLKYLYN